MVCNVKYKTLDSSRGPHEQALTKIGCAIEVGYKCEVLLDKGVVLSYRKGRPI
jgi:hypothetical protein